MDKYEYIRTCSWPLQALTRGAATSAIVGDAELDEGCCMGGHRRAGHAAACQTFSVDRRSEPPEPGPHNPRHPGQVPGARCSTANGWRVIDAKYGKQLEAEVRRASTGRLLRLRQSTRCRTRCTSGCCSVAAGGACASGCPAASTKFSADLERLVIARSGTTDELQDDVSGTSGGHDIADAPRGLRSQRDLELRRRTSVFAYTLKGWRLPSVGDPQNHSVTLTDRTRWSSYGRH